MSILGLLGWKIFDNIKASDLHHGMAGAGVRGQDDADIVGAIEQSARGSSFAELDIDQCEGDGFGRGLSGGRSRSVLSLLQTNKSRAAQTMARLCMRHRVRENPCLPKALRFFAIWCPQCIIFPIGGADCG